MIFFHSAVFFLVTTFALFGVDGAFVISTFSQTIEGHNHIMYSVATPIDSQNCSWFETAPQTFDDNGDGTFFSLQPGLCGVEGQLDFYDMGDNDWLFYLHDGDGRALGCCSEVYSSGTQTVCSNDGRYLIDKSCIGYPDICGAKNTDVLSGCANA